MVNSPLVPKTNHKSHLTNISGFQQLDIRMGTILSAESNAKAHRPTLVLKVDFGEVGIKTTSAQISNNYESGALIGEQVVAVVNFPSKIIAGIKSEVLILAAVCEEQGDILLQPKSQVRNGAQVS